MSDRIRVPLAASLQVLVPLGPLDVPLRTLGIVIVCSPIALLLLSTSSLELSMRLSLAITVVMLGITLSLPMREGVWIGWWLALGAVARLLPNAIIQGRPCCVSVGEGGDGVHVKTSRLQRLLSALWRVLRLDPLPAGEPDERPSRGSVREQRFVVLELTARATDPHGDDHARWCHAVMKWLTALERPAQLVTLVKPHDVREMEAAFARRTSSWPRTPLLENELSVVRGVAESTTCVSTYAIVTAGVAPDATGRTELARTVAAAQHLAAAGGIRVRVLDLPAIQSVSSTAGLVADIIARRGGIISAGSRQQLTLGVTGLPHELTYGELIDVLLADRVTCTVSMHVLPVTGESARRSVRRMLSMHRYAADHGGDTVTADVAAADTAETLVSLAARRDTLCQVALAVTLSAPTRETLLAAAESLLAHLRLRDFTVSAITRPALAARLTTCIGGNALKRTRILTSNTAAACLLPAVGTPFVAPDEPLVGTLHPATSPVHLSVWERANHNMMVVGSSGAGKSVAMKTLLARHVMEGCDAVIVDPDSEYRRLMLALGGTHVELGQHSINPLAPLVLEAPDLASSQILPVLSVMAGDERGVRDGRLIRRLADEDLSWLHRELTAFGEMWRERRPDQPLLRHLVGHLHELATSGSTEVDVVRVRTVSSRLERFVQGERGRVFDRASSAALDVPRLSIGMRAFAMTYAADLTAAVAVVLTSVLARLRRGQNRLIVLVDEAHRVTSDPDAGDVLAQLVRQARKHGAGVWLASQRMDDFMSTDLGRTLVATAATKLILGCEEGMVSLIHDAMQLRGEETSVLMSSETGVGLLISGGERAPVRVVPGPALLAVSETTFMPHRTVTQVA